MNWLAIGTCFTIGLTCFNAIIFILVKFNDLRHLDENMKILITKTDDLAQRISRMEGICSVCVKKRSKR
jgi:hypothetical protein